MYMIMRVSDQARHVLTVLLEAGLLCALQIFQRLFNVACGAEWKTVINAFHIVYPCSALHCTALLSPAWLCLALIGPALHYLALLGPA